MIRQDRFLLAILSGILLLVAIALALYFSRQGGLNYLPENTPQAVLQNYMLALQKGDYERAFSYVAGPPTPAGSSPQALPDYDLFRQYFFSQPGVQLLDVGVQIGQARITGNTAAVQVTLLRTTGDPFNSVGREQQQAQLVQQQGAWKVRSAPYPFWSYDWGVPYGGKYAPAVPVDPLPSLTPTP